MREEPRPEAEVCRLLSEFVAERKDPLPGKIWQAQSVLPQGTRWQGLKLKAEIEVKGMRYPVRWACHQKPE